MLWHCGMYLAELPRTIRAVCARFLCSAGALGLNMVSHSASTCFSCVGSMVTAGGELGGSQSQNSGGGGGLPCCLHLAHGCATVGQAQRCTLQGNEWNLKRCVQDPESLMSDDDTAQ